MKLWILLALTAASPAPALAAPTASQSSDNMATQVSVTRDAMDQVLTKMRNASSAEVVGSNPDFIAKADAFNARAEAALQAFEKKFRDKILKPAVFYVDRLNAILNSKAYTPEQKRAILNDQISITKNVFQDLSKEYVAAVEELYLMDFPSLSGIEAIDGRYVNYRDDGSYTFEIKIASTNPLLPSGTYQNVHCQRRGDSGSENTSCARAIDRGRYYSHWEMFPRFLETAFPALRERLFPALVREGCLSASCMALYSAHRVSYLNLIAKNINRPVTFSVGNTTLEIQGSNLELYALRNYLTLQPGESNGLPFEVSDREFADAKDRIPLLAELKQLILADASGFFQSFSCVDRVSAIKDQLCRTSLGCLRADEKAAIEKAIEESSLGSKWSRVSCLNSAR